jgi:hypothetical protein
MTALQDHYEGQPVRVLVVDIFESMATTKFIQSNYNIVPPCLNDENASVWYAYHWDNYIPSNFVIQRDQDQTLFYRAHTMTMSTCLYWIDQALAASVEEEEPVEVLETTLKTTSIASDRVEINYSLSRLSEVRLMVFDVTGKVIARLEEGETSGGSFSSSWRPERSGIYFIKLFTDGEVLTEKVVVLK